MVAEAGDHLPHRSLAGAAARRLSGIEEVGGAFEPAIYNSGSAWADLQKFMRALLGGRLVSPGLLREMKVPTPGALNGTPPFVPLEGGNVATYGLGLEHYTWSHSCGVYGHSGSFPGYHTFVFASANGRRGAAMYLSADALEPPGVIASLEAQRLVACRMRFGHIGSH